MNNGPTIHFNISAVSKSRLIAYIELDRQWFGNVYPSKTPLLISLISSLSFR